MNKSLVQRVNIESSDYEEFAFMLRIARVEQKLLESGFFYGKANFVQSDNIRLQHFEISRKVLQLGHSTPGYVTFTIWEPNSLFTWRNFKMLDGMIGVLWDREHQSVTGSDFKGIPISIKETYFRKLCIQKGYGDLPDQIKKEEVLKVSKFKLKMVRTLIQFIVSKGSTNSNQLHKLMEEDLMDVLLDCLNEVHLDNKSFELSVPKMNLITDYIHENVSSVTSVKQVTAATNIPERTVRRLITTKFQLSPKQYLNRLRLNEVRKGLKENTNSKVYQVASEFNFWHMGQFSRDYKKLFSELPSESMS